MINFKQFKRMLKAALNSRFERTIAIWVLQELLSQGCILNNQVGSLFQMINGIFRCFCQTHYRIDIDTSTAEFIHKGLNLSTCWEEDTQEGLWNTWKITFFHVTLDNMQFININIKLFTCLSFVFLNSLKIFKDLNLTIFNSRQGIETLFKDLFKFWERFHLSFKIFKGWKHSCLHTWDIRCKATNICCIGFIEDISQHETLKLFLKFLVVFFSMLEIIWQNFLLTHNNLVWCNFTFKNAIQVVNLFLNISIFFFRTIQIKRNQLTWVWTDSFTNFLEATFNIFLREVVILLNQLTVARFQIIQLIWEIIFQLSYNSRNLLWNLTQCNSVLFCTIQDSRCFNRVTWWVKSHEFCKLSFNVFKLFIDFGHGRTEIIRVFLDWVLQLFVQV